MASAPAPRRSAVTSGDVELAVFSEGDPGEPTILLVHGFPDTHRLWDGVAARLAGDYHVVRYDVRGAGESSAPRKTAAYRTDLLAEDLFAVADAVSPNRPVHVVAHDWGSIQSWAAVTAPRAKSRIASFTSISGPSLDHVGQWLRRRLAHPSPANLRKVITQLNHSWYIAVFHIPVLPALAWRTVIGPRWHHLLRLVEGIETAPAPTTGVDAARGVRLYRANMLTKHPKPRETEVPVQVVIPTRDRFVTPGLAEDLERWIPRLWRRRVAAGHWVPLSHPDALARMVDEFVGHVRGAPMTRGLQRARAGVRFTNHLVVITGAGKGIGRATALAFAASGAEVVVADIDVEAAKRTAEEIGPAGYAYQVDVSDAEAVLRFAQDVAGEHGVPDVVVNNAGIGMAGPFLATTDRDWRRVTDVNLLGVVNGCREFGALMAEAGEGGYIVNVASAAAYTPSRSLSAYAASKAAVLALSDCVRAEFAAHDIGISAICPGVVATDITNTTTFAGADAVEQQRLRQRASKAYARRGFTPERVAEEIVRAVRERIPVLPVTPEAKLARIGARFAPGLMRRLARLI
ncbi:NAD(P)-dependent dehydrogenase (short-subunit alcohol dehydrogenase family)/pimeloyl-ACP methyl ester carboxylesterase [Actinokineospora baliensis]|uniref:SDR family oxidoreductase n=1 Tax=Actinokineospora baliensis TaxID=547056 RepID=UPI0027DB9A2E|nr:SDR family oxidoreductase [Actinokineospora baliensis]MBM7771860.1 NAD(P)-dependent dehydrogenase (short-subunit alcohol dehydrogenase family)/pimeloyl-ACP methyl ester carboxylesterase [Actinokineospora baliensis]